MTPSCLSRRMESRLGLSSRHWTLNLVRMLTHPSTSNADTFIGCVCGREIPRVSQVNRPTRTSTSARSSEEGRNDGSYEARIGLLAAINCSAISKSQESVVGVAPRCPVMIRDGMLPETLRRVLVLHLKDTESNELPTRRFSRHPSTLPADHGRSAVNHASTPTVRA